MEANENNMKLIELLEDLNYEILNEGLAGLETEISSVVLDSRKAEHGCLFTCVKGAVVDGHIFAADVAKAGAGAIIVEDAIDLPAGTAPVVVQVPDKRLDKLAEMYNPQLYTPATVEFSRARKAKPLRHTWSKPYSRTSVTRLV